MEIEPLLTLINQLTDKKDNLINLSKESSELLLFQTTNLTELNNELYTPVICLILQGKKKIITDDSSLELSAGKYLIVSHTLPVYAQITQASPENPYLTLILNLDLEVFRAIYKDINQNGNFPIEQRSEQKNHSNSIESSYATPQLLDALYRLVQSTQDDTEYQILYQQIKREIHYRLLTGTSGEMLRNLLHTDSKEQSVTKAIQLMRERYTESLNISHLAQSVGMSASSFFHHFKRITRSSPLQFQKSLRLVEARRLICCAGETVTSAAYKVGYESPNQFSRDYTKKFSINPSLETKR